MVKIIITILILLLPVMALGQMPNDIDSLSLILTERMTMASTGTGFVTPAKLLHELNIGIQNVCEDFPAIERIDTLYYAADSDGVGLASDFDRLFTANRFIDGIIYPLTIIPPELEAEHIKTEGETEIKMDDFTSPKYCYSYTGRFFLTPKFTRPTVDTIIIKYYAKDLWLSSGDTTVVKNKYLELIIFYAMSNLWADRGRFTRADYYTNRYEREKQIPPSSRVEEGEK